MATLLLIFLLCFPLATISKTTIEPCSGSDSCTALLGYTLYTDLKVSEVASLFTVDPLLLLAANSLDFTSPSSANRILPSGLFLRVPTRCACSDGVRKSVSTRYSARPGDTLASVAGSIFSGLASADQIHQANALAGTDPDAPLDAGQQLVVPLPCVCFNSSDNGLPAVYLSYVVREGDSVAAIAATYQTTVADVMNVNSLGSPQVSPGDIMAIPLPACASMLPSFASDSGLLVANGSYSFTAGHCVQCSCGPGNLNLYCTPASLAVSCSSMQCANSNLMLGNITAQPTSAGCNVTSCNYGGFVNGSILTSLTTALQPQCPGKHLFPPLTQPPTAVINDSDLGPALSPGPAEAGGAVPTPRSSVPGFSLPSVSPGPAGSTSGAPFMSNPNRFVHLFISCLVFYFQL